MDLLPIACAPFLTGALTVAARAGIADCLAEGPKTAAELAGECQLHEGVLARVMRLLASAGIFSETADGRFENNEASKPLRSDVFGSVRHFCILAGTEYARSFADIWFTATTGGPAFQHVYGGSIYRYMDLEPEAGRIYDRAMEDLARPVGALLSESGDFTGIATVVDIGGGGGALLLGLLRAFPHMQGICVDRQGPCERGAARLKENGEADLAARLRFVPGDFFKGVPAGGDLYLLKNVLHNWTDASARRILETAREAMRSGVRLLVIESLLEEGKPSLPRAMDDLFQMVICEPGTTARSETGMRALVSSAGFRPLSSTRLATGHTILTAERP